MYYEFIEEVAFGAGEILLKNKSRLSEIQPSYKESEGLVSEVDHESETYIKDKIEKKYPSHFFLGEEDTFANKQKMQEALSAKHCWYVDPLDGTNNYLNNLDYFCVSIAHSENGVIDFGMVYAPEREELYYASKGNGAFFRNLETNKSYKLSSDNLNQKPVNRSFCVTSLNSLGGRYEEKFKAFKKFNETCLSIRRFGSAALELCHTAQGLFDTCWDYGLKPWDVNAGVLICEEAGLRVKSFFEKEVKPIDSSILVTRKHLEKDIQEVIDTCFSKNKT